MPDRPLLTFDLDGVLCRPPLGINPGRGLGKRREAAGTKGILWATERWRYLGRRPMPGAIEGFQKLAADFDCAILSARSAVGRRSTEAWLQRFFGVQPPLNLRPGWEETSAGYKVRMVGELRPLAHFEDDPHTALWLSELIPAVFLVDWRRNRWLEGSNIYRIRKLEDALPTLVGLRASDSAVDRSGTAS